jgi:predicted dehydrogenase
MHSEGVLIAMPGNTIRVGIVGANVHHGFAIDAHIPALRALPGFEIVAVCTTRRESAAEAADLLGAPLSFTDPEKLAQHPDVDLVAVSVRVPSHRPIVMAAIEARKHVYCEWPLGRDLEEARQMCDAARRSGIRHLVGLQGRMSPSANYARDLVARGDIGRVLSATMTVSVANREVSRGNAFMLDRTQGMNTLTITGGHTLDLLRHCLGDFRELVAMEVNQRRQVPLPDTPEVVQKSTLDQLVVSGMIGDDIAVSYQIRGGGRPREPRFSFEIHGEEGDLLLTSNRTSRESMQRQHLNLSVAGGPGARHTAANDSAELTHLEVPDEYRWVPPGVPAGAPFNVAQMYVKLAESIHGATPAEPGFEVGVSCHQLLDGVTRASDSGRTQSGPDIFASPTAPRSPAPR